VTTLKDFTDDGRSCFANVQIDNDDPCWINVASSGVLVKKPFYSLVICNL
jgi:hypothetical protein